MLTRAYRDLRLDSTRVPGEHYLEAVYPGPDRVLLQVWENGECTWKFTDD
jgi:hypothetical protein